MLSVFTVGHGWIIETNTYVSNSDTNPDLYKYGVTAIDENGYPEIPLGQWSPAVSAWRHPTWKRVINPDPLYEAGADWIWRIGKVSGEESKTGSIVYFKKLLDIPPEGVVTDASLKITADNAFLVYLTNTVDEFGELVLPDQPIFEHGFKDPISAQTWEIINGYYVPIAGVIDTHRDVVRTIEEVPAIDLINNFQPGENWLVIVGWTLVSQSGMKTFQQLNGNIVFLYSRQPQFSQLGLQILMEILLLILFWEKLWLLLLTCQEFQLHRVLM
jgi:hypothetical protein